MPSYLSKARSRLMAGALVPLLLAGCMTSPQEAPVVAQPKTLPVTNLTSFSESLRCMDNLLAQFGRRSIVVSDRGRATVRRTSSPAPPRAGKGRPDRAAEAERAG